MSRYEGCCDTCKFCWQDFSVGASECECEDITEEAIIKHFEEGECGCPYYEEDME